VSSFSFKLRPLDALGTALRAGLKGGGLLWCNSWHHRL